MKDIYRHAKAVGAMLLAAAVVVAVPSQLWADGMVIPPANYEGSLEEQSQEAMIIFQSSDIPGGATEDLILKITVEGAVDQFAWVIPLPNQPTVKKADAKLFKELYDYVAYRLRPRMKKGSMGKLGGSFGAPEAAADVKVLSREIVGSYDVAVVRENRPGTLNKWLGDEGYQRIRSGEEVIEFYRRKGYVFTCVKVSDTELTADKPVDLHPLRLTFKTGGRDGIYFPMKMTGLQERRFDVNLYVFYGAWLNDRLNKYGYEHRGFHRKYRDWDSRKCKPNAGKNWARPKSDPFLRSAAARIPTVAKLLRELHPGERHYLTNIQAFGLDPAEVRNWPDDLWLFPYYVNKRFIPYDARPGSPAAPAYQR